MADEIARRGGRGNWMGWAGWDGDVGSKFDEG
jgi:hypothetical protein